MSCGRYIFWLFNCPVIRVPQALKQVFMTWLRRRQDWNGQYVGAGPFHLPAPTH